MNIIIGYTTTSSSFFDTESLQQHMADKYGPQTPESQLCTSGIEYRILDDDGAILGKSELDNLRLFYIGAIHAPLPCFDHGSPLNSPDEAADYLLDRYRAQGSKFMDDIPGQYAVAVIDDTSGNIVLACDPDGLRSWFIYDDGYHFAFSSNLGSLASLLNDKTSINKTHEDFMLIYGFYPENATPFNNINKLSRGTVLVRNNLQSEVFNINTLQKWRTRDLVSVASATNEDTIIDILYDCFLKALEEQCPENSNVAVLLGGFDSALVASGLKTIGRKVETFSFYYENSEYNQPHTDTLATFLNINHNWINISEGVFRDGLLNFSARFNSVTNWPNYVIQTEYACKKIREKGYLHCYTGDGCDATFMGYPATYRRAMLLDRLPRLPNRLVNFLIKLTAWSFLDRKLGHPYRVALNFIRSMQRTMPSKGLLSFRVMDELTLMGIKKSNISNNIEATRDRISSSYESLTTLRLAYLGKSIVSPNTNKIVGSSDSTGLAILSPYLHPGLKELALSLPDTLCRPDNKNRSNITGKYILMKMAEKKGLLPSEIIYQKKMAAVDAPIDEWYSTVLRKDINIIFQNLPFKYNGFYLNELANIKASEELFKKHILNDKVISHAVSLLLTYASFASLKRDKNRGSNSQ